MPSYESFASVYDLFMDNVPYETWCQNVITILDQYQVKKDLVAELGCGTGKMTRLLSEAGYDMIGIDNSFDMLDIAMSEGGDGILYLCQDMREFELYGTVGAVVSVCDSMNYITDTEDLATVMKLVNNYLDPGGIFVFDMNTIYKYEELLSDGTFAENRLEGSFIWENEYNRDSHINAYDLTLYIADESGDSYERYEEEHYQRAYSLDEVKAAIAEGGMEFVDCMDVDTMGPLTEESERMYVICREHGKE